MKKFILFLLILTTFVIAQQPFNPVSLRYYIENIPFAKFHSDSINADHMVTDTLDADSINANQIVVDTLNVDTLYVNNFMYVIADGDTVKIDPGAQLYIIDLEVGNTRIFGIDSTGKGLFVGTVTANGAILDGGTNTFSLTNGTASLDVAAAATINLNKSLTVNGQAVTIAGVTQANTITLNESITIGGGYSGTLTYSADSKTLTVEDNSVVNQDLSSDANVTFAKVIATELEFAGNITLDPAVDGASYVNLANSGTGAAKLYIEGDQVNSDDLSDVASIAMLDEAETVTGKWTFSDTLIASKAVKGADGVLLTNETATKATLPSNTSWMYPYDDGSSVHLMATKDDAGTETVVKIAEQSSITNLSAAGPFYYGDGTDDYISIADNANLRFGTGNFGLIFKNLRLPDYTPSAAVTIARKANAGAENLGWIFTLETDGKPQIAFGNATNFTTLVYKSATAINATDETTIHLAAIVTRETASVAGSVKFYQFGYDTWKLLSSVAITAGTPQTVTETTPSALVLFQNIDGTTEYAFQSFGGFIPCNFAPTYAEVKEFVEKGLPNKYQWGSQTNKITVVNNQDFSAGTIGNWVVNTDGNGTCTYDGTNPGAEKVAKVTVGATAGTYTAGYLTSGNIGANVIGKIYVVTARVYLPSGHNFTEVKINFNDGTTIEVSIANIALTNQWQTIKRSYTATATTSTAYVWGVGSTVGDIFYFDDISVTQLGAVAAYTSDNMTASTAYDASSNKLNGTVTGATLLNAKVADAFNNPNKLPTDDALLSIQDYSGYDGSGNVTDYGYWQSFQRTVLNGDESWGLKLSGLMDNAISNLMEWDLSGVAVGQGTLVFNEDGKDIDVRIESDINNAISVDGATGNVILGAAADVVGALTAASVVSDAQVTATTTVSGATYGSNGSVTDAELLYVNTLSSNAQDQLDARCLESVFGTAIGTGLTLDATTLKTHAALQSIAGLTEADVSILEATADNTYSVVTSGGNNYMLASDGTNANLVFVQPSTVLSSIGAQPVDANLTSIAGLSHAVGDILYANAATTYLSLADVAAGQPLLSGGVTTAPAYAGYTFSGTAAQTYTFPTSSASLAPLAAPTFVTSFTSPGIDDNADAIAITIDVTTEKVNMSGACDIDGALTANVFNYYADTSSVNDSWGFTASSIGAYTTGLSIFVNIGVANTDGATLQINALGAKAVLKMHDTALATNNVEVGQIIHLIYDGTQFQMLSQVAN